MNHPSQTVPQIVKFTASENHRTAAKKSLAMGVSSTPRAAQLPVPLVIDRAEGAVITDIDGNHFIDYTMGYGPLILGHTPQGVLDAIRLQLEKGLRTATVNRGERLLAEMVAAMVPSAEITSFLSSGTEAVQLALRIARASTGKLPVIKFRANYHGWFDSIHVANTIGNDGPGSAGQDPRAAETVVVLDWGDTEAFKRTLTSDYAAVILEPAAINAGCFQAPDGFLAAVRELTRQLGVVLIFDEVITGFRMSLGGAQQVYSVTPDITVLGKALGAGLPISAVTGEAAVMQPLTNGTVNHRGTFNGNPLSAAAGIACLEFLQANEAQVYPRMDGHALDIKNHINAEAARLNAPVCANQVGSAVQIFGGTREVATLSDLGTVDRALTMQVTAALVGCGINPLPRGLMYLSAAHTSDQVGQTKAALSHVLAGFARD